MAYHHESQAVKEFCSGFVSGQACMDFCTDFCDSIGEEVGGFGGVPKVKVGCRHPDAVASGASAADGVGQRQGGIGGAFLPVFIVAFFACCMCHMYNKTGSRGASGGLGGRGDREEEGINLMGCVGRRRGSTLLSDTDSRHPSMMGRGGGLASRDATGKDDDDDGML